VSVGEDRQLVEYDLEESCVEVWCIHVQFALLESFKFKHHGISDARLFRP
jgi:hypothetical protein